MSDKEKSKDEPKSKPKPKPKKPAGPILPPKQPDPAIERIREIEELIPPNVITDF